MGHLRAHICALCLEPRARERTAEKKPTPVIRFCEIIPKEFFAFQLVIKNITTTTTTKIRFSSANLKIEKNREENASKYLRSFRAPLGFLPREFSYYEVFAFSSI